MRDNTVESDQQDQFFVPDLANSSFDSKCKSK